VWGGWGRGGGGRWLGEDPTGRDVAGVEEVVDQPGQVMFQLSETSLDVGHAVWRESPYHTRRYNPHLIPRPGISGLE